jgi:hypothetical protein
MIALLVLIGLVATVGVVGAITGRRQQAASAIAQPGAAPMNPGRPQPGPAPPGKVWSTEHGHWHDASAPAGGGPSPVTIQQTTATAGNVPQPAGQAPPGKVWSPEHGHWHDAPK